MDYLLHLDRYLNQLVADYHAQSYLILFLILFAETGLVVTPFLPGDSLLFTAGALAATQDSPLNVGVLYVIFILGALTGDNTNYWIGKLVGPRLFRKETSRLFKRQHLDRTHAFFEKYGGKTVIIARFVPIVRTFAPFVAGLGAMTYLRFLAFSIAGACLWVGVCVTSGYFFGNLKVVKNNFSLVILAIVFISLLPAIIEVIKHRRAAAAKTAAAPVGKE
jgi:membrane-associated protein